MNTSRRDIIAAAAAVGTGLSIGRAASAAVAERRFDFTKPLEGWETITGKWAIEDLPDARGAARSFSARAKTPST